MTVNKLNLKAQTIHKLTEIPKKNPYHKSKVQNITSTIFILDWNVKPRFYPINILAGNDVYKPWAMSWKNVSLATHAKSRLIAGSPPLGPDPLNSFIGSYEKCNRTSLVESSDHKRVMATFTPTTGLISYSTLSKLLTICSTVDACDPSNVVRASADSFEHGIVFSFGL